MYKNGNESAVKRMYTQIVDNIYSIYIPIPNNPLKNLNAYLIKGEERNLLIDTGFSNRVCREAMYEGLDELGVSMENTDIFITHMHSDHTGLVNTLATPTTRVFISAEDKWRVIDMHSDDIAQRSYVTQRANGFMDDQIYNMPVFKGAAPRKEDMYEDYITFDEGAEFEYGGHTLRAVFTPGHTPGHMCLYDEQNEILFLGDHVLFDITPNVSRWMRVADSLGMYISSLVKIRDYKVKYALPAHRGSTCSLAQRVDQIIEHHGVRVRETLDLVYEMPGATAYDIAGKVTWNIRHNGDWEDFPLAQKTFAVGEMRAHLEYLVVRDRISCEERAGVLYYYPPNY